MNTENNKLIAEFMGFKDHVNDKGIHLLIDKSNRVFSIGDMEYHRSWDWLMPVVEKIETITLEEEVEVIMDKYFTRITDYDSYDETIDFDGGRMITTYTAVVNFIKWYNKHK